jgi:hypothetical protein
MAWEGSRGDNCHLQLRTLHFGQFVAAVATTTKNHHYLGLNFLASSLSHQPDQRLILLNQLGRLGATRPTTQTHRR